MGKLESKCVYCEATFDIDRINMKKPTDDPRIVHLQEKHKDKGLEDEIRLRNHFETIELVDLHRQYLENLEKELKSNPRLKDKYKIRKSYGERLYLPYWKGKKGNVILSSPDMLLENEDNTPEYILELEYNVSNKKKLVGIALLTDMAIGIMKMKKKPKLILIIRKEFSNSEFIEKEIKAYIRNIEFKLFTTDTFDSSVIV